MSKFTIKPDIKSIIKSKKKFIYFGIFLLAINFYFIFQYLKLMTNTESFGYYLCILIVVNFPIFIVSLVLLFLPIMYKRYYTNVFYQFDINHVIIGEKVIDISTIQVIEDIEFLKGIYKVYIHTSDRDHELNGICYKDLNKIKNWLENKKI